MEKYVKTYVFILFFVAMPNIKLFTVPIKFQHYIFHQIYFIH